jgi:hypothetical protein
VHLRLTRIDSERVEQLAGGFSFARRTWGANWSMTYYAMEFLAERAADPSTKDRIRDLLDNNVPFLDLRDPEQAPLVDILADELVNHVPPYRDPEAQRIALQIMTEIVECARDQQEFNRDPNPRMYYHFGPNPAKYFDADGVIDFALRYLHRAESVRIDVSYYDPEQRKILRERLAELADPRLMIVGDT